MPLNPTPQPCKASTLPATWLRRWEREPTNSRFTSKPVPTQAILTAPPGAGAGSDRGPRAPSRLASPLKNSPSEVTASGSHPFPPPHRRLPLAPPLSAGSSSAPVRRHSGLHPDPVQARAARPSSPGTPPRGRPASVRQWGPTPSRQPASPPAPHPHLTPPRPSPPPPPSSPPVSLPELAHRPSRPVLSCTHYSGFMLDMSLQLPPPPPPPLLLQPPTRLSAPPRVVGEE